MEKPKKNYINPKALLWAFFLFSAMSFTKSDHYDGSKFHNLETRDDLKSFFTVLKWKLTADSADWPQNVPIKNFPLRTIAPGEKVVATFINHATFLLQLPGLNIITDPIYSKRASPVTFAGPARAKEPGIGFDFLPPIDVVTVTHNHYDHLDIETLKILDSKFHPLFLIPLGDKKLLEKEGIQNVKELDWWEEVKVKDVTIVFTPSQHWSARGLFDKNESLWGAFYYYNDKVRIYHGGDTGYAGHFKSAKEKLGAPDLALLPIGAYEPRWFMKDHHMNPDDAVQAHQDLGSKKSLGMHFGIFQLTDEGISDPEKDLEAARKSKGISAEEFMVLEQGQAYFF